ncbi:30S ribosomal protein S20 [Omnitrophica bacterium]|nr:30S ribosomal protein S20 [Candidatus Omnitrophota bacterium]
MPNIQSAKKRMRSNAKKSAVNQAALSELRTLDQQLKKAAADPKKAAEVAKKAVSRYDKAVSRGIIPRGRANRKKSRIAGFLKNLKTKKKS